MADRCPVCSSDVNKPHEETRRDTVLYHYSCPRCGDYLTEDLLEGDLPALLDNDDKKVAVLSHWIRTRNESKSAAKSGQIEQIILDEDLVENILKQRPPSPAEQAHKFILWLGNSKHPPGELVPVQAATHQSIMGAITPGGFLLVLHHLTNTGLLHATTTTLDGEASMALSFEGWQYYEELCRGAVDSHKAFMAMKYGDRQLDTLVDDVFKPAVKQTGFDLSRLVDRPKAGLIDDRLRMEIQTSRFLIADLTHENAGAYWEAGYAEGLGKPVIYTCEKKKFEASKTHFDTNHHLTVPWDPDQSQEVSRELKATIRATLPAEAKLTDE